jgi:hypothetical protein
MREIYKVERILNVGIRLYECTSRSPHQTWYRCLMSLKYWIVRLLYRCSV